MKSYPVVFEIHDEHNDLAAKVRNFDAETVEVEIKTVHNSESWAKLSAEIAKCIKVMTS